MIGKFASLLRHPADAWNYLFGVSGLTWSVLGVIDSNTLQAWGGAIVAVLAVFWGFFRDQKRHDRIEEHAERSRKRVDEWEEWALDYRRKKLDETGVDPFKGGIPPLTPFGDKKEPASA